MEKRVLELIERFSEVEKELGDPAVFDDQKRYRELSKEHAYLSSLKDSWLQFEKSRSELEDARGLRKEEQEEDFLAVLDEEIEALECQVLELEKQIHTLLVPPDPDDDRNTILEVRAGTGGDEAALFVGDLVRMYKLFADKKGWRYEALSGTEAERGGFKEYIMVVSGVGVHRFLRYEAGTHRVQRVPETEAQGRVHTSAATVAVLMEPAEDEEVQIDEKDLRIETFRASGAGGQHVNTTDSAVRITHVPTNTVAICQDERSQHKNKAKAMRLLQAKIAERERMEKAAEIASTRAGQVGSGDRSERIRTYNFPQNRLTDHRINLTLYALERIMNGEVEDVVSALVSHFYQERLEGSL